MHGWEEEEQVTGEPRGQGVTWLIHVATAAIHMMTETGMERRAMIRR